MGQAKPFSSAKEQARLYIAEHAADLSRLADLHGLVSLRQLLDMVIWEAEPKAFDIEELRSKAAERRAAIDARKTSG